MASSTTYTLPHLRPLQYASQERSPFLKRGQAPLVGSKPNPMQPHPSQDEKIEIGAVSGMEVKTESGELAAKTSTWVLIGIAILAVGIGGGIGIGWAARGDGGSSPPPSPSPSSPSSPAVSHPIDNTCEMNTVFTEYPVITGSALDSSISDYASELITSCKNNKQLLLNSIPSTQQQSFYYEPSRCVEAQGQVEFFAFLPMLCTGKLASWPSYPSLPSKLVIDEMCNDFATTHVADLPVISSDNGIDSLSAWKDAIVSMGGTYDPMFHLYPFLFSICGTADSADDYDIDLNAEAPAELATALDTTLSQLSIVDNAINNAEDSEVVPLGPHTAKRSGTGRRRLSVDLGDVATSGSTISTDVDSIQDCQAHTMKFRGYLCTTMLLISTTASYANSYFDDLLQSGRLDTPTRTKPYIYQQNQLQGKLTCSNTMTRSYFQSTYALSEPKGGLFSPLGPKLCVNQFIVITQQGRDTTTNNLPRNKIVTGVVNMQQSTPQVAYLVAPSISNVYDQISAVYSNSQLSDSTSKFNIPFLKSITLSMIITFGPITGMGPGLAENFVSLLINNLQSQASTSQSIKQNQKLPNNMNDAVGTEYAALDGCKDSYTYMISFSMLQEDFQVFVAALQTVTYISLNDDSDMIPAFTTSPGSTSSSQAAIKGVYFDSYKDTTLNTANLKSQTLISATNNGESENTDCSPETSSDVDNYVTFSEFQTLKGVSQVSSGIKQLSRASEGKCLTQQEQLASYQSGSTYKPFTKADADAVICVDENDKPIEGKQCVFYPYDFRTRTVITEAITSTTGGYGSCQSVCGTSTNPFDTSGTCKNNQQCLFRGEGPTTVSKTKPTCVTVTYPPPASPAPSPLGANQKCYDATTNKVVGKCDPTQKLVCTKAVTPGSPATSDYQCEEITTSAALKFYAYDENNNQVAKCPANHRTLPLLKKCDSSVEPGGTCTSTSDCAAGFSCAGTAGAKKCVIGVETSNKCGVLKPNSIVDAPPDSTYIVQPCATGYCPLLSTNPTCTEAQTTCGQSIGLEACGNDKRCDSGSCVERKQPPAPCQSTKECKLDDYCSSASQCTAFTQGQGEFNQACVDNNCRAGLTCDGGTCRYPKASDTTDSNYDKVHHFCLDIELKPFEANPHAKCDGNEKCNVYTRKCYNPDSDHAVFDTNRFNPCPVDTTNNNGYLPLAEDSGGSCMNFLKTSATCHSNDAYKLNPDTHCLNNAVTDLPKSGALCPDGICARGLTCTAGSCTSILKENDLCAYNDMTTVGTCPASHTCDVLITKSCLKDAAFG